MPVSKNLSNCAFRHGFLHITIPPWRDTIRVKPTNRSTDKPVKPSILMVFLHFFDKPVKQVRGIMGSR